MSPPEKNLTAEEWEAVRELREGGGTYYVTQERAFAPGIAGKWPSTIKAPQSKHGRLVKRTWPRMSHEQLADIVGPPDCCEEFERQTGGHRGDCPHPLPEAR